MQLLGLVNTLLAADAETRKRDLSIRRYAVIPLAPLSGLLSWVRCCCLCLHPVSHVLTFSPSLSYLSTCPPVCL